MVALRKKNKTFCSNMIDKLRKMGKKYPVYEQGANSGPDNVHPERRRLMLKQQGK